MNISEAAKDAEIARLKNELAKWQCQSDDDEAMEIVVRQERDELVEALKKARGLFCKPDEPMQKFPNWAQAILVIDAALKKVGAE